jgi:hypothetical protein
LSAAYQKKAHQLTDAQVDALRIDHNHWFGRTCVGDRRGGHHLTSDVAVECLRRELPKRREFVLALPVDLPEAPYRLSGFERTLLQRYAGLGLGLVNGMDRHSRRPEDAVRSGLRRVFAAVLPARLNFSDMKGSPPSQFIQAMFGDSPFELEADHYFVDYGAMPHNGSLQGAFVVDLETGELTLALIDAQGPTLDVWEKACTSSPLRDFSRARFQKIAAEAAVTFQVGSVPVAKVSEHIRSTTCH